MPDYTITLTDAEDKALAHDCVSPQQWIENAIKTKCRKVIKRVVESEITRIRNQGGTVSGTDDEIVMAANLETGAERLARESEMDNGPQ